MEVTVFRNTNGHSIRSRTARDSPHDVQTSVDLPLRRSEELATGPDSGSVESNLYHHTLFIWQFQYYPTISLKWSPYLSYIFLVSPMHATCPAHFKFLDLKHAVNNCWATYCSRNIHNHKLQMQIFLLVYSAVPSITAHSSLLKTRLFVPAVNTIQWCHLWDTTKSSSPCFPKQRILRLLLVGEHHREFWIPHSLRHKPSTVERETRSYLSSTHCKSLDETEVNVQFNVSAALLPGRGLAVTTGWGPRHSSSG
jgi:hypothetical protein